MTKIRKRYLRTQKLMGLLLVIAAVLVALLTGGDGTVGLLFVPVGLYFIFTKKVIVNRYAYIDEMKERRRTRSR